MCVLSSRTRGNAFSYTWINNYFYIFPPFSLVGPVLAKIRKGKTNTVIFSAITKKFDIATQTFRKSAAIQKTAVSSNQGNKTTEKNLEISLKLPAHCKYNNYIKQWTSILKNRSNLSISCIRFSKWNV